MAGILVCIIGAILVSSAQQTLGKVEVTNFTRHAYGAGNQNWAITADANGRLYIANNEGLLTYNGTNWQLYPVPNKTILRCISFGEGGKLFAGAQDELGYYAPDRAGRLVYTSLKNLLPETERTFADIWDIEINTDGVFFRATDKIFRLHNNTLSVFKPVESWLALGTHHGKIIAQDRNQGLLEFENNSWHSLVSEQALPAGFVLTDLLPLQGDTSLVSSADHGLFTLAGTTLQSFRLANNTEQHFLSLAAVDEKSFLAGSYANGLLQVTKTGTVQEVYTDRNGLPNNTVRYIKVLNGRNVWLGLDNGIATLNCDDAIRHINPTAFSNGSGYGACIYNNTLHFALSTGLQQLPLTQTNDLSKAAGEPQTIISGLTWNVAVINNQLVAGRDDGFWQVNGQQATRISANSGYWRFEKAADTAALIAAGNYTGVRFFRQEAGQFTDLGSIRDFTESSRYMERDGSYLWVSHPYRGVFRINLADRTFQRFSVKDGLPNNLDNHVFRLRNKIVFATLSGIFEWNAATGRFEHSAVYAPLFGNIPLRFLREDEKGNIWFVKDKMVGVADYSGKTPVIHYIPELKNRILSGFENIFPYNSSNVFIGSESGFYFVNYEKYRQQIQPLQTYLTRVQVIGSGDSILYGGYGSGDRIKREAAIPYKKNSIHISFATSLTARHTGAEFSWYLEGFDNGWSNWSNQYEKDYTNLPEGDYVFHVKARNSPSSESTECTYTFAVAPPWFRTWWAYVLYFIIAAIAIRILYKMQERKLQKKQAERIQAEQRRFEDEQRQLTYQHALEMEKAEMAMIKLKNQNLEAEITHKNAELASTAMNLVQKKEFLLKITDELNKLCKPNSEQVEASELKKIIRSLGSEEKLDEDWKQFSIHFNSVHSNFLVNLKKTFPALNAHELKLCAYLRMNLSSKEIAQLLSITVRGVEISRYRLRKKLQVPAKEDLFQFLLKVEGQEREGTTDTASPAAP